VLLTAAVASGAFARRGRSPEIGCARGGWHVICGGAIDVESCWEEVMYDVVKYALRARAIVAATGKCYLVQRRMR
jgi:hypothetical protein